MIRIDGPADARRPMSEADVRERLAADGLTGPVAVLDTCDSTNRVAAELAPEATAAGGWALVAAEEQTAGRGRMGRTWVSPRGAGVLFTVLLDVPGGVSPSVLALVPLATGVAVAQACRGRGADVALKWPNDVVVLRSDGTLAKVGGILVEHRPRGLVVGVGLNHSLTPEEGPPAMVGALPPASLLELGLGADRADLLAACTAGIVRAFADLRADPADVLARYRRLCVSLGRRVRVEVAGRDPIEGEVVAIDAGGHLVLRDAVGDLVPVTAGDVRHLP